MRDGLLPAALLCASLGLALATESWRMIGVGLVLLAAAAVLASRLQVLESVAEPLFLGAAVSTAVTAASVYLPRAAWRGGVAVGLALNAGGWAGAVLAVAAAPADLGRGLVTALATGLVAVPAALVVARGWGIAAKVAASWLIAVAVLAATLPIVPTPGYVSDHMQ